MKLHLEMLSAVSRGLSAFNEKVVFIGGATVELYILDPGAPQIRLSEDVDCVIEVTSQVGYHKLDKRLSALGFKRPDMTESAPICRWIYNDIRVDFLPTDENILGYKNQWYPDGFKNARVYRLPDGQDIYIFTLPYFLASKMEAFDDRGNEDFRSSADIEDMVAVLDGSRTAKLDIQNAPKKLKAYLKSHFAQWLSNDFFLESLEGHTASFVRAQHLQSLLQEIAQPKF